MSMKNKIFGLLIASALLFSCNDKDDITPSQVLGGNALSSENIVISPTGGDYFMSFTSESAWTLVGEVPEWLSISSRKGNAGTANVKFSAEINDTEENRDVYLTFDVGKGNENPVIHIKQDYPYMKVVDLAYSFTWNQSDVNKTEPFNIRIDSNIKWKFVRVDSNCADWFNVSESEGTDDAIVTVNPKNVNIDKCKYISKWHIIPFKVDEDGNEEEISEVVDDYFVEVDQANLRFLVNDSVEDFSMDITQLNAPTLDIQIDCEKDWVVESKPEWIRTSIDKAASGIVPINLAADGVTPDFSSREGKVVLKCSAGAYRTLNVKQEGYVFTVSSTEFNFEEGLFLGNNDLESREITLTTAGGWELKNIPEWLEVTPSSCEETFDTPTPVTIQVKAKEQNLRMANENPIEKMCFTRTVKPHGVQQDPLDKTMSAQQAPFIFDVTPSSILSRIPTMSTDKYDVHIVSSGKWSVQQDYPEWLDVSKNEGETTNGMTFTVGANCINGDLEADRNGKIIIVSELHKEKGISLTRELDVLQSKFIFELDKSSFSFKPYAFTGQPSTFTIKSSTNWSVEECPDWVKMDKKTGDGTSDVKVTITPESNSSLSSRSNYIIITNPHTSHILKVTVDQEAFVFNQDDYTWENIEVMNKDTKTISFDFSEGAEWEVESGYPSWMNPSIKTGKGGTDNKSSITFTPQANPNLVERSGDLYIKSHEGNHRKKITFKQKPFKFDNTSVDFDFATLSAGTKTFEVLCSAPWTISGADWVTFTPSKGAGSDSPVNVSVKVTNNLTKEKRTAVLKLTNELNGLAREINLSQNAFCFNETPVSLQFEALSDVKQSFDVVCSGEWALEGKVDWVNVSKVSGSGNQDGSGETVEISVKNNDTESPKSFELKFVSKDNKEYVKKVTVKQGAYVLKVDQTNFSFEAIDTSIKSIKVTSTSSWTAKSNSSWLTVTGGSGAGDGTFTIQPAENTSTTERSAVVTVSNPHNSITKQITVTQAAAPAPEPEPEPEPVTR